jgi:hypothetical protein
MVRSDVRRTQNASTENVHIGVVKIRRRHVEFGCIPRQQFHIQATRNRIAVVPAEQSLNGFLAQIGVWRPGAQDEKHVAKGKGGSWTIRKFGTTRVATWQVHDEAVVPQYNLASDELRAGAYHLLRHGRQIRDIKLCRHASVKVLREVISLKRISCWSGRM